MVKFIEIGKVVLKVGVDLEIVIMVLLGVIEMIEDLDNYYESLWFFFIWVRDF